MKPKVDYFYTHEERNINNPISFRADTRDDCSSNEDASSGSHVLPINQDNTTQDEYPLETIVQEHARPRLTQSSCLSHIKPSNTSLCSSITKFRTDFEDLKCKMLIFGESLNLCKCIASDFTSKLQLMEKRLQKLEKRQVVCRTESNYSAIINMNKMLSQKTMDDAKKLQMCGTEAEMREVAGRMCRNYLHGAWKTVDPKDLDFRRISGGLSNFLYYVALPDDIMTHLPHYVVKDKEDHTSDEEDRRPSLPTNTSFLSEEPKKVLLRIYGQVHGDRAMDAIVTESVIFTLLSERKLGPKLYGVFSGGRIEQYIPARPLLTRELAEPALSMKIAEKMAAIHSMDVPLSKEPKWVWKKINNWVRTVTEERLKSVEKNAKEQQIQSQLKQVDFEKEIEWVRKLVLSVESPSVFCHNDMQEGNILLLEEEPNINEDLSPRYITCEYESTMTQDDANTSDSITSRLSDIGEPKLVLIDFEYCAYNYRGFDIANHFQEWVFDYTNPAYPFYFEHTDNAPTLEQKEIFIKEYLKHYNGDLTGEQEPSIDDINHVLAEVDAFSILSNLFWSLWSFVNASKSQIPFGYWEYGLSRLHTYQRLKQEHIKKESSGIPQKRKICEVDI